MSATRRGAERRSRVLVIVQNLPVPFDRRVWLECTALTAAGYDVTVVCPRGTGDPRRAVLDGVTLLKYRPYAPGGGSLGFVVEYAYSFLATAWLVLAARRTGRFDVVQACNPPDIFWPLARLLRRLDGTRFVFDHHDLCPELYDSRFPNRGGPARRGLVALERATFRAADHVVSTNASYADVARRRGGVPARDVTVVRTGPDPTRLRRSAEVPARRRGHRFLVAYLGVMGPQDGVDVAVRAAAHVVHELGRDDVAFTFMGRGDCYDDLVALRDELGLQDHLELPGRVPDDTVAEVLSTADVGLSPDPSNPLNDVSTMNKTLEYMAFGLPVVAFDLKETRVSAGHAAVYVAGNDPAAYARALVQLLDDAPRRAVMGALGRQRIERDLGWPHQRGAYVRVFDDLTGRAAVVPPGRPRVLIENSEYWLRNNGDLAMLAVTIRRLRERWPAARIAVLTDSPALLRAYFPQAEGISVFDEDPWAEPSRVENLAAWLGPAVVGPLALGRLRARVWFRVWLPHRARGAVRRARRLLPVVGAPSPAASATEAAGLGDRRELPRRPLHPGSARAAAESSLVLALGGGYLTDADPTQTVRVLNLLDHASDAGVPVALVGQGLGPVESPGLRDRAAEVLPKAGLISLREARRGPDLLRRVGVDPDRVLVTGDDAVELACEEPDHGIGSDLGICLRDADYAPVPRSARNLVGRVVRAEADRHAAALVPLVIAEYRSQDRRATLPVVRGASGVVPPLPRYVHPSRVVRRVARCRVVVTSAYHLAVFALSQGIPVVALTSTQYYDDKFLGLADMFGEGVEVVRLDDPMLAIALACAVEASWSRADEVRDRLRARARSQVEASRAAFDRVFALLSGGEGGKMMPDGGEIRETSDDAEVLPT